MGGIDRFLGHTPTSEAAARMQTTMTGTSSEPTPDRLLLLHSRWLSRLFLALFVLFGIIIVVGVGAMFLRLGMTAGLQDGGFAFSFPFPPLNERISDGFRPVSTMTVPQSSLVGALLALRWLPGLIIIWLLHRLFDLYARGHVFSFDNAVQMRRMAIAFLGYALVPFITHGSLYVVHLSPIAWKLETRQIDAFVLGLVLLTIARVMAFGHDIERDRETYI